MRERAIEFALTLYAGDDVSPDTIVKAADIFLLFLEGDEVTE